MAQHDSSYHLLFSHPELVEDLLRHFIPEDWVAQLDFSRMERVNAKLHAEGLDQRDGDLIYRIQYRDGSGEIYLYLLLEFQSRPDKWMALRTLVYVGLLYQQLIKEKRLTESNQLPPVFPLVLYNGDSPWHSPEDLQSLIALPANTPLWQWQPQMRYYLLDESRYPEGKTGSLAGTLFRIENSNDIKALRDSIQALEQQIPETEPSLRRAFAVWIYYVLAPHKGLQLDKREVQDLTEVREMLATRVKQWEQDLIARQQQFDKQIAEQKRIAEQVAEQKRQEGRLDGEATLLRKMLELKFGALPEWAEQRFAQADASLLEQWAMQLLNAASLEDVFK